MQQIINIREVNQNLSRFIHALHEDDELIITKHGKAVAKLVAIKEMNQLGAKQQAALQRLMSLKTQGYKLGGQGINRDELYDR